MKDLIFTKECVTCNFKEAENLENIKSGERLSVIFGKIQKLFNVINDASSELAEVVTLPEQESSSE